MRSLSVRCRAAAALGVCVAACAAQAPAALAADHAVNLTTSKTFSPAAVAVAPGDSVTWHWAGDRSHNVTADAAQAVTFASGDKTTGTFTKTFTTAGRYTYRCTLHGGMNGSLTVAAPSATPDTTPPNAPAAVVATAADATVTIDWADSTAPDLANYVVQRRVGSGAWGAVASPLASVQTDTTVANATTYSYRVGAVDTTGNASAWSAAVDATPVAPPPTIGPATRHVAIASYQYAPSTITVNRGDTVQWDWTGADLNHSVSSLGGLLASLESHLGALVSAIVGPPPGGSYSQLFDQVGTYQYFCRVHPDMTGAVNVVAAGAPATQPTDPPSSTPAAEPPPAAKAARTAKTFDVKVAEFAFTPPNLAIALGDVVKWSWTGADLNHSVTATSGQQESFESHPGQKLSEVTRAPAGGSFSHVFTHEGTFTYFCRVHPDMTGRVTVGPAPVRVRIVRVKRGTGSLRVSYRLTKPATVKAIVYRAGKRVVTKTTKGRSGTNSLRIVLPRAARRAALKVVLRGGADGGVQARASVRAVQR